jgi:hypothetical protein
MKKLLVLLLLICPVVAHAQDDLDHYVKSVQAYNADKTPFLNKIAITDFGWTRYSGIYRASFAVTNKNDVGIKAFVVVASIFGPNGAKIGEKTLTVYQKIAPGERKIIKDLDFGVVTNKTVRSGIAITELSFYHEEPKQDKAE